MKTFGYNDRPALVLLATCLFFGGYIPSSQGMTVDAQPRHPSTAASAFPQPIHGAARLVIFRDPGLGNFTIAHLYIDGSLAAAIGYGRTFVTFLPPGRHVLSLLPTPNPKWWSKPQMILNVKSGQTYTFTAIGRSGYLVLRSPDEPELPRGR
jgi:hypothetical protein